MTDADGAQLQPYAGDQATREYVNRKADGSNLMQFAATPAEQAMIRRFAEMTTSLPAIPQDGGISILASIFEANSLEELDKTWSDKGEDWAVGREFLFESLAVGESDYSSGIGFFLLVTATDLDTGEQVKFDTGSVNVMGQLVQAHHMGMLPFVGKIVRTERKTRNGYNPMHILVSKDQTAARRIVV